MLFVVECSRCIYSRRGGDAVTIQALADQHERETGHKGPFVWSLPNHLAALRPH